MIHRLTGAFSIHRRIIKPQPASSCFFSHWNHFLRLPTLWCRMDTTVICNRDDACAFGTANAVDLSNEVSINHKRFILQPYLWGDVVLKLSAPTFLTISSTWLCKYKHFILWAIIILLKTSFICSSALASNCQSTLWSTCLCPIVSSENEVLFMAA